MMEKAMIIIRKITTYLLVLLFIFNDISIQKAFSGTDTDVENYENNLREKVTHFRKIIMNQVDTEKRKLSSYVSSKIILALATASDDYKQSLVERKNYYEEINKIAENSRKLHSSIGYYDNKALSSILPSLDEVKGLKSLDLKDSLYNLRLNIQNFEFYAEKIEGINISLNLIDQGIQKMCKEGTWNDYPFDGFPPVLPTISSYEASSLFSDPGVFDVMALSFGVTLAVELLAYAVIMDMSFAEIIAFMSSFISISMNTSAGISIGVSVSIGTGSAASAAAATGSSSCSIGCSSIIAIIAVIVMMISTYIYYKIKENKAEKRINAANKRAEDDVKEILDWLSMNSIKKVDVENEIMSSCKYANMSGGIIYEHLKFLRDTKNNGESRSLHDYRVVLNTYKNEFQNKLNQLLKETTKYQLNEIFSELEKKNESKFKTVRAYDIFKDELMKNNRLKRKDCLKMERESEPFKNYLLSLEARIISLKDDKNKDESIWNKVKSITKRNIEQVDKDLKSCLTSESILEGEL